MVRSKILASLALLLLFASTINAGPIRFIKHHKRLTERLVAATVGTIVEEKGVTACSRGNVEKCAEGYGSRRGFAGFATGLSFAMVGVSYACDKDQPNWWFCDVLGNGIPATQIAFGIHDFTVNNPCVYDQPCGGQPVPNAMAHELFKRTELRH
jgi:hypothetical protein